MGIKSFNSFNEEAGNKWIQDAIKNAGALRKSLGKKSDEKISKSELSDEISKLKKKDKDPDKKGVQGLSKKDLTKFRRLNLAKTLKSLKEHQETQNYMFFGNLETMKRMIDELLSMDQSQVDSILTEHDWASDHISVAAENLEHVFNFLSNMGESEEDTTNDEEGYEEEDNTQPEESEQTGEEMPDRIKGFEDFE